MASAQEKAEAKKAELLAELAKLEVEVTGEESNEDLAKLLKDAKAEAKKNAKVESVKFTLKNGAVRVFSPADHGEDFLDVAAEFEKTHAANIASKV